MTSLKITSVNKVLISQVESNLIELNKKKEIILDNENIPNNIINNFIESMFEFDFDVRKKHLNKLSQLSVNQLIEVSRLISLINWKNELLKRLKSMQNEIDSRTFAMVIDDLDLCFSEYDNLLN